MSRHDEHSIPPELQDVARRLEAERPQASDLELDRIKLKAMSAASRAVGRSGPGIGQLLRSGRLLTVALALVLMVGSGAVLASSGGPSSGSTKHSASKTEYPEEDCGQDEAGSNDSFSKRNGPTTGNNENTRNENDNQNGNENGNDGDDCKSNSGD